MADDVEQLKISFWASCANANGSLKYLDWDSQEEMVAAAWGFFEPVASETIATLRADRAKAVEGLEAICEAHVLVSLRGRDHVPSMRLQQDCIGAAQSLIKELRT